METKDMKSLTFIAAKVETAFVGFFEPPDLMISAPLVPTMRPMRGE